MRLDKLTTKFQEALTDAQSLAVTRENPYIEPSHLLLAMLQQDDGPRALLERAGVNVTGLKTALEKQIAKLPQVQGGEQVQAGRDTVSLLQGAEKEAHKRGDPYIASEMFLLALADHKGDTASVARDFGLNRKSLDAAVQA
ncbi:MAG: type VI secretion system ATPase TssH, partial [Rubrivivax sp.]